MKYFGVKKLLIWTVNLFLQSLIKNCTFDLLLFIRCRFFLTQNVKKVWLIFQIFRQLFATNNFKWIIQATLFYFQNEWFWGEKLLNWTMNLILQTLWDYFIILMIFNDCCKKVVLFNVEWYISSTIDVQEDLGLIPTQVGIFWKLSSTSCLTMDCKAYSCYILITCYIQYLLSKEKCKYTYFD